MNDLRDGLVLIAGGILFQVMGPEYTIYLSNESNLDEETEYRVL